MKYLLLLIPLLAAAQPAVNTINLGAAANDRTGDVLRVGGAKINANFTNLWREVFTNAPVNPKNYGITGDGTTDDSAGFQSWASAMTNGQWSHFPAGTYRIATPGVPILQRTGLTNILITADNGTRFIMANSAGTEGTSHGISFNGPASNIRLENIHIEWSVQSTNRSASANWMGFMFYNQNLYTTNVVEDKMLRNVTLRNCSVTRSPGLGICFAGVDGAVIENNVFNGGLVDGIYIRTSRRIRAVNNAVYRAGDDGFSIATYEYDRATASIDADYHGEGSIVDGLIVEGPVNPNGLSAPAGVWIGGVRDVSYNNIVVRNYSYGVRLNCGYDDLPMTSGGYSILAPQNVNFGNAVFHNVQSAIALQLSTNSLGGSGTDPKWWKANVVLDNLRVTGETPTRLFNSQMTDGTTRGLVSVPPKYMWHGLVVRNVAHSGSRGTYGGVLGLTNSVLANIVTDNRMTISGYQVSPFGLPVDDLPRNDVVAENIQAAEILIQGLHGGTFDNLRTFNSPGRGITINHSKDIKVGAMHIENAQQTPEGAEALYIQGVKDVMIDMVMFKQTNSIGIAITDTNNVATHLNRYYWFGNQHFADLSGARIYDITATRLGIREVNWYNANEPGTPQWYQMRMDSRLGVGTIPNAAYAADLAGNLRLTRSFPTLVMNDTNQVSTNGGLFRIIGEPSYNGGYHFAFNTAAGNDFTSSKILMRLLSQAGVVGPGTPGDVDLGQTYLPWRATYNDTMFLTALTTNRYEIGVEEPDEFYINDSGASKRLVDTDSGRFNVYKNFAVSPAVTNVIFQVDSSASTDETPAILLINGNLRRVIVGAPDSAGVGYRQLRVLN